MCVRPRCHDLSEASVTEMPVESHQTMQMLLSHTHTWCVACVGMCHVYPCTWISYREGRTDLHCPPSPKLVAVFTSE